MQRLKGIPDARFLLDTGVIAIARGIPSGSELNLCSALYEGGIRVLEVTMNTPGACGMIEQLRRTYQDRMWIGAGTVLTVSDAESALASGAQFFVTPHVDVSVITYSLEHGIPIFSGALTPTEIVTAYQAGAAAVKVFPSKSMGPGYLQELQGPLRHIPMIAVGGISVGNATDFLNAGAIAIGVGGNLVNPNHITRGEFKEIENYARHLVEVVNDCRDQRTPAK